MFLSQSKGQYMTVSTVEKFSKGSDDGGFLLISYYQATLRLYNQVLIANQKLLKKEVALRLEAVKYGTDEAALIYSGARKELMELDDFSKATQIFACMAVESFMNYYGVVRFGEKKYKKIEWLGAKSKLAKITSINPIRQDLLEDIEHVVEYIFRQRNSLVHPKSKQDKNIKDGKLVLQISSEFPADDAKKMVDAMKRFLQCL